MRRLFLSSSFKDVAELKIISKYDADLNLYPTSNSQAILISGVDVRVASVSDIAE